MKYFRYKKTLIWAFIILILCIIPIPENKSATNIPQADKLVHLFLYLILTIIYLTERKQNEKFIYAAIIFSIFGLIIEIIQYFIPYRSAELKDWLADILGIISVWAISKINKKWNL